MLFNHSLKSGQLVLVRRQFLDLRFTVNDLLFELRLCCFEGVDLILVLAEVELLRSDARPEGLGPGLELRASVVTLARFLSHSLQPLLHLAEFLRRYLFLVCQFGSHSSPGHSIATT